MEAHPQYVPNLRTKGAEWEALRLLAPDARDVITPCLEILPTELDLEGYAAAPGLPEAMNRFARKVARSWGSAAVLVDVAHINASVRASAGEHPLTLLGRSAKAYKLKATIAARLYDDSDFQAALRDAISAGALQAAVRLHFADLDKESIHESIDSLVSVLGTTYANTDVLVDCGVIDETPPPYDWMCSRIPNLRDWRRFVIVGGSFPVNLEGLPVGSRCQPRYDWLHWQAWTSGLRAEGTRRPDFSDYTVQHPVFYPPPAGANPSASIRYASENYWVIMRGGPLRSRKTTGHNQYYGNAQLLCERDEFSGATYSHGDKYISDVADRRSGPGTPTTWLTAAINRHMTLTSRQVSVA